MMLLRQVMTILWETQIGLRNKKLFWLTLILSFLAGLIPLAIGQTEYGITLFGFDLEEATFGSAVVEPKVFYGLLFSLIGAFWLTWIASILGLVSTSGLVPDLIADGSIELTVSRPVRRTVVLLSKFLGGLLFMAGQVCVFTLASFFAIGIQGGGFIAELFLALPIVLVFFSFLSSFCLLMGVLTRSTIASLLLTILFWFFLFLLHQVEGTGLFFVASQDIKIERAERIETQLEVRREELATLPADSNDADIERKRQTLVSRIERAEQFLETTANPQRESAEDNLSWLRPAHQGVLALKTVLPKTAETMSLLTRQLADSGLAVEEEDDRSLESLITTSDGQREMEMVSERLEEEFAERSVLWILGTSLAFEFFILSIACWRFSRRDF
ncbi:MAG: ABC transporter permease [Planctomycetota bacterium]